MDDESGNEEKRQELRQLAPWPHPVGHVSVVAKVDHEPSGHQVKEEATEREELWEHAPDEPGRPRRHLSRRFQPGRARETFCLPVQARYGHLRRVVYTLLLLHLWRVIIVSAEVRGADPPRLVTIVAGAEVTRRRLPAPCLLRKLGTVPGHSAIGRRCRGSDQWGWASTTSGQEICEDAAEVFPDPLRLVHSNVGLALSGKALRGGRRSATAWPACRRAHRRYQHWGSSSKSKREWRPEQECATGPPGPGVFAARAET
mmetsp:Transcript_101541/g.226910  ORF Transcript_101541/g.226910 Transcript_101541/m.226910 type:complete len:258 (-) Transcript_101541:2-775(-)